MENTKLYKEMVEILNKEECSIRQMAKKSGISYLTLLNFYNKNSIFRPISQKNKARLHNHFGIDCKDIDEYNDLVYKEREG